MLKQEGLTDSKKQKTTTNSKLFKFSRNLSNPNCISNTNIEENNPGQKIKTSRFFWDLSIFWKYLYMVQWLYMWNMQFRSWTWVEHVRNLGKPMRLLNFFNIFVNNKAATEGTERMDVLMESTACMILMQLPRTYSFKNAFRCALAG